ncbi:meiosis-specific nuclear structural protein 1 [Microplitis demolitor]|uniref:meiosis-specific nuclear structural protein 1 n=1 Tax=Microplitis demolitor TaxID=69319 RepID=UPI00235B6860|nr:meiosis-specific nuclear structural protein 1 [Microplitis demolitor]
MDKILSQRDRYISSIPHSEQMKEKFRNFIGQLDKINRHNIEQLTQESKKIERLKETISEKEDQLLVEEKKKNYLNNELENQAELLEELPNEKSRLIIEKMELESRKNQLKATKPSNTDQKLLEHGRKKLEYYRILTGIRWDYPMLKTCTKGYVTNRQDYTKEFCFNEDDERTEEKIWEEIGKCVEIYEEKENSAPNK